MADHGPISVEFNVAAGDAEKAFRELSEKMRLLGERRGEVLAFSAQEDRMSFEQQIRQLAKDRPGLTLAVALEKIDSGADGIGLDLVTIRDRAEWILEQPDIVDLLENRKINAIKEVRARTYLGLKEAKEAVEYAVDLKKQGWMSKAEKAKLEEEAREAIASILGATEGGGPHQDTVARCPKCGHAPHGPNACYNLASDNDCECPGV